MLPIEVDYQSFIESVTALGVLATAVSLAVIAALLRRSLSVDSQKVIVPWEKYSSLKPQEVSQPPAIPEEATLAEILTHLACYLLWKAENERRLRDAQGPAEKLASSSSTNIRAV